MRLVSPQMYVVVACAMGFGVWNLIARWSGAPPHWVAAVVSTGTLAPVYLGLYSRGLQGAPPVMMMAALAVAGLINGVGMVYYGKIISPSGGFDLSRHVPMVLGAVTAINAVGGVLFFGDPATLKMVAGLVAVIAGIWLLNS